MSDKDDVNTLTQGRFKLGDFVIDPDTNKIYLGEQAYGVESKAMALLLVLVRAEGAVVDQETLFAQVWPNSVFSSGSIRRCIAMLRKILNVESNADAITTYPKKGYRLNLIPSRELAAPLNKTSHQKIRLLWPVLLCVLFALAYLLWQPVEQIQIRQASPLTASHHQEFKAKVSPNGKYVAFLRATHGNEQQRTLWLKSLNTEQERQVADYAKEYAWSADSEQIAYSTEGENGEALTIINLVSGAQRQDAIEFSMGKRISSLQWSKADQLYYLARQNKGLVLLKLDLTTTEHSVIRRFGAEFSPYEIAYSEYLDRLAIAGFTSQGNTQFRTFDLLTENSAEIATVNSNRYFLSWHPSQPTLLVSDGKALFSLDKSSGLSNLGFENYHFLQHPQFLPDASGIVFSQGRLDVDIFVTGEPQAQSEAIANSNTVDSRFALSPDGGKLSFISNRKGYPQIYLYDFATAKSKRVYDNPNQLLGLSAPVWSRSGTKLAFSNYQFLVVLDLSQDRVEITEFDKALGVVKDWNATDSGLIAIAQNSNLLVEIDLLQQQSTGLLDTEWQFAVMTDKGELLLAKGNSLYRYQQNNLSLVEQFATPIRSFKRVGQKLNITTDNTLYWYDVQGAKVVETRLLPKAADGAVLSDQQQIIYQAGQWQKDIVMLQLESE